jgi:hypothetical protein
MQVARLLGWRPEISSAFIGSGKWHDTTLIGQLVRLRNPQKQT